MAVTVIWDTWLKLHPRARNESSQLASLSSARRTRMVPQQGYAMDDVIGWWFY